MPPKARQVITWSVFAIAALVMAAAAAISYTAVSLPGCTSCHTSQEFVAETNASPHANQSCTSCHVDPSVTGRVTFATRQVFHMVIPIVKDLDRSYAQVPAERCLSCHSKMQVPGTQGSRGLLIDHVQCTSGTECVECHSPTAHGTATTWPRTPRMESCYDCHGVTNKVTDCDSCHAPRREEQRVEAGTFSVTHGPEWETTHGMGDMGSCSACHEQEKCVSCHGPGVPHPGDFIETHAEYSVQPTAQCTACHLQSFCDSCHAYPMPHDQQFILGHSDIVEKDGEDRCVSCHDKVDCATCHESHVHPVTQEQMDGITLRGSGGD